MTIALSGVSVRGRARRDRPRAALTEVSLEHRRGILAIVGAEKDGTSLLLDVLDATTTPRSGRVSVLGGSPDAVRARVARVTADAPLPESLRVDELCDLASDLRGEARLPARERLDRLGLGLLARRWVRSLTVEERRAVSLAIALSSKVEVILVEEPLAMLDPVAPRLVVDALRVRASDACIVATTASVRDAMHVTDRLGILTNGVYSPLDSDPARLELGPDAVRVVRFVISAVQGASSVPALMSALSAAPLVTRVDATLVRGDGETAAVAVTVSGRDLLGVAKAITRAIASARVDVDLVEPNVLPLDAIRAALALGKAPPSSVPPSGGP